MQSKNRIMKKRIQWLCEGVELPQLDFRTIEEWIYAVATEFGKTCGDLGYCFCDDERILEVNREFLKHDYYTDIITFDYSRGKRISGDMYISLDTVRTNAELLGQPYDRELKRVIIHGILHLCGINDKAPGEREIMERYENRALDLYKSLKSNNNAGN